ncbi:MAG: hypothetical protein QHC90_20990 [Shinella sp.]|nr:hypothetical protein [Shinella sp.]
MLVVLISAIVFAAPFAVPAGATAETALDFKNFGRDKKTFDELPGVQLRDEKKSGSDVVCVTRHIEPRFGASWRIRRELYYFCTKDGVTYESDRAPISRERDLRGYGW